MKKLIFVMCYLLSVVAHAQPNLGIKYPSSSSATGIPYLTGNGNSRLAIGGTDFVIPSALNKSAVGLSNVDNTSDVNKPVSTAQATAIGTKLSNITGLVSGTAIASGTGTSGDPYVINSTGGGGSSTPKQFSVVAYASSLNINFNSTTSYVTTATGNISFTNSGVASGQEFTYKIIKNTSSDIGLTFPSSSWTAPSINNMATGAAKEISSTPPGFTLTGASGSIYSIYIKYLDLAPLVYLNYHPNFYDPPTLLTNMVVFDGRAAYVDAGVTTAETSVYHIMVPSGTMKANSKGTVKFWMKRGTSGSNVQYKVRVGASTTPTANSIVYDFGVPGNVLPGLSPAESFFQNNNSTSSQICPVNYNAAPLNNPVTETNFTIPTGGDFYIDITVQKTASGDTGAAGNIELILSNI